MQNQIKRNFECLAGLITACFFLLLSCAPLLAAEPKIQPVVFNNSETVQQAGVFALQGSYFGQNAEVWCAAVSGTRGALKPLLKLQIVSSSDQQLSALIPDKPVFKAGTLIAVWVKRTGASVSWSRPVFLNRARAVTLEYDQMMPGQTFRVFGRNLKIDGYTPGVRFVDVKSGQSLAAAVTAGDLFSLQIVAPRSIRPGRSYRLVLSNGNGGGAAISETAAEETIAAVAAAADPFGLKAPWGTEFTFYRNVYNVREDPRLKLKARGDGLTDDRLAIQQAIDLASNTGGGVLYFPEGKYKIDIPSGSGLVMKSRVVLKGEGYQKTVIQYGFGTPPPYPDPIGKDGWPNATTEGVAILWPLNTTLTGLYQLCLQNVNTSGTWRHSLKTMPPIIKKPGGSGSKFFAANCRFDFAVAWGLSWGYVDRMMITDCIFDSKARVTWPWLWHCTGATNFVVRNNRVRYAAGRFGFNDSFNGIIENNHITRLGDLINPKGETGGFNIDYAKDIVVLKNRLDVEGKTIPDLNQGETILSQGGNPEHMATGHVTAGTAKTLRDDSQNWGQIRTRSLSSSDAVAIIYGKGMGQWRYIKSNTKNTLLLSRPWDLIPDITSRYSVMRWSAEDWLVKDNILEDNNRGIWFYCGSTDVAITGNTLTNSEGIYIRSDQRLEMGRYNLSWNISVCDNKVVNTNGLRPAYVCNVLAIGTKPDTLLGTGSLGVEIRRNLVQAYRPNKNIGSFVRGEGYFNEVLPKEGRTMPGMRITGVTGTIFESNTAINADIGYRLYGPIDQTVIKSPVYQNVAAPLTKARGTVLLEKERKSNSALQWQPGGITIVLKDDLAHRSFSWPESLVRYKVDFGATGIPRQKLLLREKETGKPVLFQLDADTLCFLSDLPSRAVKTFELLPAKGIMQKDAPGVHILKTPTYYILSNGKIRIQIPASEQAGIQAPISRFGNALRWLGHGELQLKKIKHSRVEILAGGPVLAVVRVQYFLEQNRQYTAILKLTAGMEFAELEEEMQGFEPSEKLSWKMVWDGIAPDRRYVSTRVEQGTEKMADFNHWEPMEGRMTTGDRHPWLAGDQQNGKDGLLPFRLAPYDNWLSWWRLPSAAFRSGKEKTTIGLFIKDMERWNDGKYALWGSKKDLNITFHWKNELLDYTFPLVTGTRSIALAAYPQDKDLLNNSSLAYVDELRRWQGWIPLDKVKNWVLSYEEPESGYPRFFKPENATANLSMAALEQSLSAQLQVIAKGSERISGPTPVGSRIYYDQIVPAFDLNAPKMSAAQYRKLRAWYLFVSYLYQDESLMPMRNLLSGHPNFLADIKGVTGLSAFLFPKHPEASRMADHFEKMIQLTFNYHIRPDVPAWEAHGGRWTENLATYTWAALTPMLRTNELLRRHFDGKNRILQPGASSLANWLLNSVSSPLESLGNKRTYPPQGAHARTVEDGLPDALRIFAQQIWYDDPKLSEQLLWLTDTNDKPFESTKEKAKAWKDLPAAGWEKYKGANPGLKSAKFTGYGFVLRSAFNTKDEMYVHLQQIDDGPNYRWGRAAMGGNGVIYYYAAGKKYSHNGPEDAGDGPFGDTERITNFGVKKPGGYRAIGPYRSVGRNDLTEPLYDFGFAQFATVLGNKDISRDYQSRSILQSSSDYIAIYDDIPDPETEGRLSWFVGANDEFPYIHQVLPGAAAKDANIVPGKSSYHKDPAVLPSKGRYYDGKGSFFTIVTHKPEIRVKKTYFGCIVQKKAGQTDLIFRNNQPVQYSGDGISFSGRAGIVQFRAGKISAALFEGTAISIPGINVKLPTGSKAGISIQQNPSGYSGTIQSRSAEKIIFSVSDPQLRFYLDGSRTDPDIIPEGKHQWAWSNTALKPDTPEISAFRVRKLISNGTPHKPEGLRLDLTGRETRISWGSTPGAETYRLYRLSRASGSDPVKIYEGFAKQFSDQKPQSGLIYDYMVTALKNGQESKYSAIATTDPSNFLNWEPMRGEGFRRDTENHENGFPEFDPVEEDAMPVLVYPTNKHNSHDNYY